MPEIKVCEQECAQGDHACCYYCKDKCDNPCELELEECGLGFFIRTEDETKDMVNHPSHYTQGKFECIEVIEEITKPCNGFEAYLIGTILKYLWRWKFKNGLEDIKKARWYLDKLIEKVEDKENENN